jgi:hypothetical protein
MTMIHGGGSVLVRGLAALAVCAAVFNSGAAMAIEEPAFELIEKLEPYEIRQYRGFIVAETFVDGDLDAASNAGFRLIADYIFGNNLAVGSKPGDNKNEKIAMTTPVAAEPVSEKIAMTVPVLAEPQMAGMNASRWRIHFVMPSQYSLATLPKPVNPAVQLRAVPGQRFAVLVFSGFAGAEKVQAKSDELLAWVKQRGLKARGVVQLARYNPPWTLPFFRRNEVMVEVITSDKNSQ